MDVAVRASTASERAQTGRRSAATPVAVNAPIRTCIGCRKRAAVAELLRVVVARDATGATSGPTEVRTSAGSTVVPIVPDPRRRALGRGAWLHCVPGCVELAERRRAFARALRVPGRADSTAVRAYVVEVAANPTGGTPQEM